MYFVNQLPKFNKNKFTYQILPVSIVFTALLILSIGGWQNAKSSLAKERQSRIVSQAEDFNEFMADRLQNYEVVLRGSASLFNAKGTVTRDEWKSYVQSFDIQKHYPGFRALGYSAAVSASDKSALVDKVRTEGFSDFSIYPESDRLVSAVVLYLEPLTQQNRGALGFDMYSENQRKETMDRARQSGDAQLTGKVMLTQSQNQSQLAGFLMYIPVYIGPNDATNGLQQKSLQGFSYATFSNQSFFSQLEGEKKSDPRGFRIYDGQKQDGQLLYESPNYNALSGLSGAHRHQTLIDIYGKQWIVEYVFSPEIVPSSLRNRPTTTLVSSVIISFMLASLVFTLLVARTRSLAVADEKELGRAKDELLSLASHQLRTPATGVKQYIGMLKDGYAGSLSDQQYQLLDKAYQSNERQLHIINELLYVAKVDNEGIVLTKRPFDLTRLVKDVVDEQQAALQERKLKIETRLPKRGLKILADERCIRMTIENLVSNAIKYSYEKRTITVTAKKGADEIQISVKDQGIGISPEEQQLLFQRFSRIPNELSMQVSGSGLGLYLAKRLVELHGGSISFMSKRALGSTFTIHLPLPKSSKE